METKNPVGRPLKFATVQELENKLSGFFDHCKKEELPPTVEELCVYLDCDKQTVLNYQAKDEFEPILGRAKLQIASYVMSRALKGELNPTIAIWVSKNHYGYSDTQYLNMGGQNGNNPIQQEHTLKATPEELESLKQYVMMKHGTDSQTV